MLTKIYEILRNFNEVLRNVYEILRNFTKFHEIFQNLKFLVELVPLRLD
jgi:hypothetical protein